MILQGTSERIQPIRWIFYSLFAVYIGYLLHDLFIGDSNQPGRYLWTMFAIGSLIVAWDSKRYLESRSYKDMANDFLIQDETGQYNIKWDVLPKLGNTGPNQSEFDESLMEKPDGLISIGSSK